MQAVMETAFDILYLCTVCILGFTMIRKAKGSRMLLDVYKRQVYQRAYGYH